jgi:hypothetical protein
MDAKVANNIYTIAGRNVNVYNIMKSRVYKKM